MTLHDDRFIYDDMPASAFERETSADKIAKLEFCANASCLKRAPLLKA